MSETEFESSPDAYKVKLDTFEGPLDLLIHLIKRNEVNIYDIPIALVTEQYLSYITLMQELNLDVAGEFLVMASTLIHIKSRMLLPRPDPTQDDQADEDPRFSLLTAFKSVLERASRRPHMVLPPEEIPIETRIGQLLARLSETEACGFEDLFADGDGSRGFVIVTFLALLEMIRLKLVRVFQSGGSGAIRVYKRARPVDAPHPIGDPQS